MFLTGDPGWKTRTTEVFPTGTNEHFCTSGTNQNRMDSSPFLLRKKWTLGLITGQNIYFTSSQLTLKLAEPYWQKLAKMGMLQILSDTAAMTLAYGSAKETAREWAPPPMRMRHASRWRLDSLSCTSFCVSPLIRARDCLQSSRRCALAVKAKD